MGSILSSVMGGGEIPGSPPENSRVKRFHSSAEWEIHFSKLKDSNKLVVIDFSASWCGPCRFIEPVVETMAKQVPHVEFVKIDVDELKDVAEQFGVDAMPTFVLWKEGKEVDRVVGARKDELQNKVSKYAGEPAVAPA